MPACLLRMLAALPYSKVRLILRVKNEPPLLTPERANTRGVDFLLHLDSMDQGKPMQWFARYNLRVHYQVTLMRQTSLVTTMFDTVHSGLCELAQSATEKVQVFGDHAQQSVRGAKR
ncbi:jg27292 [Pararge aegeria aegeria]|uniref:Jg27292 protein n=1 Tax=Pararge aegeria aegeria TaxID=348720 RepID=A0A8S4SJP8_9NEOP|nr:jg27292 [Pararge aegeria aegeria]